MPAIDDLKTANASLKDAVNKLIAEVQRLDAKITAGPAGTSDADIATVITDEQTTTDAANAAVAASQTAVP